jgi:hypothetical protein
MTTPPRSGAGSRRPEDRGRLEPASFSRNLRYELAGEEGRALLGSYAISFALGAAFLLLVFLYPPIVEPVDAAPVVDVVVLDPEPPPPPPPQPTEPAAAAAAPQRTQQQPTPQQPRRTQQTSGGDVTSAFGKAGTGGFAGDVAGVLRGVDISSGTGGSPGSAGTGRKAVISGGSGTGTAATPGRTGGDASAGGSIGNVGGSGGVGRASVGISAPRPVSVADLGRSRSMGDLGTYVRSRQAELRFCYEEHGLKVNPRLAGTITVAIGIAENGRVTSASITNRTWSGSGVSAVESCVLSRIRGWRFPAASDVGTGTYAFPFNFTH